MCSVYARSLFSANAGASSYVDVFLRILEGSGPGLRYAILGFVLVSIFTAQLARGRASLPLSLPQSSVSALDESASWRLVETFVVLLLLFSAIIWAFPFTNFIYYLLKALIPSLNGTVAFSVEMFVQDVILVLIAIRVIGSGTGQAVRRAVHLPGIDGFGLAILFPVGIAALISLAQFLYDLLRGVVHQLHNASFPQISSYFTLPKVALLSLLLVSFGEEVIFRGVLQPRFIRRYGLFRGLVLLSVVFAAAHIDSDFADGRWFTDGVVMGKLGLRLISAIGLCFITGWLTLRSRGSVLPAAITHGLGNILGSSPFGPAFSGIGPVIYLLRIALAYALFRYWPVQPEALQELGGEAQTSSSFSINSIARRW